MKAPRRIFLLGYLLALVVGGDPVALAQAAAGQHPVPAPSTKRKVFIDQDGAGRAGTDMLSTLALLQAPDVEVVGITITSGDVWMKDGVQNTLRMLELTGHGRIPVAPGGEFPFVNTREETAQWQEQFGEFSYTGAWSPRRYHEPDVVSTPAAGPTTLKPVTTHGANLLIDTIRRYPNEVTVWVGAHSRPWPWP